MSDDANAPLEAARRYHKAGFSVIPIRTDGSKATTIAWKPYQTAQPSEQDIERWWAGDNASGVAIVCGAISELETIDFDEDGAFEAWQERVEAIRPGLLDKLPIIQTPKVYGRHVYLRRTRPGPSRKLAERSGEDGGAATMIEIKGEGGYILAPGSPPACHPSGNEYVHVSGPAIEDFGTLPYVTDEEYEILVQAAQSLNEHVKPSQVVVQPMLQGSDVGDRPGDVFNRDASWTEILTPHGWKPFRQSGEKIEWTRPGKDKGTSATTGYCWTSTSGDLFYVFSSNAEPLEPGRAYSKFSALAMLNHNGDFAATARAVAQPTSASTPSAHVPPTKYIPWSPFPLEALPDAIANYTTGAARSMVCDPAFIAPACISAAGISIGTTRVCELKSDWCVYPITWIALVSESGTQKTPAMEKAFEPLRELERQALDKHREDLEAFRKEHAIFKIEMKTWEKKADGDPPSEPDPPPLKRYTLADTTTEALVPTLEANPRGIGCVNDELSGWFGSFDMYKGGKGADVARWLQLHKAGTLIVDRKHDGVVYVPRAAVSVYGTIQPGILSRALTQEHKENGLQARLLLAAPPRRPKVWTDATIPWEVKNAYYLVIRRLAQLEHDVDEDGHPVPIAIPLDDEAREVWIQFYNEHGELQAEATGARAASLAKIEEYAVRLALIFFLAEQVQQDNPCTNLRLDAKSMRAGITVARWFAQEHLRIDQIVAEDKDAQAKRWVIEFIRNRGGSITANQLGQGPRRYRGDGNARATTDLENLVQEGLATKHVRDHDGKSGRPTTVYVLTEKATGIDSRGPSLADKLSPEVALPTQGDFDSNATTSGAVDESTERDFNSNATTPDREPDGREDSNSNATSSETNGDFDSNATGPEANGDFNSKTTMSDIDRDSDSNATAESPDGLPENASGSSPGDVPQNDPTPSEEEDDDEVGYL